MQSMIKVIIFDLGGVLFKTDWVKIDKAMQRKFGISTLIRSKYGKRINREYDKTLIGKSKMKNVFELILEEKGEPKNLANKMLAYYKKLYSKNSIANKELLDLIKKLKRKHRLACFTTGNESHFECRKKFIEKLFHHKFASFKIGKTKRTKAAFFYVLKRLKVKPDEVLLIDNAKSNISVARSIGIKGIRFRNNRQLKKELNELKLI
jgi:HAD superfamily hydrolase (TIGR01509 family)